jgi:hypothetical protein
MMGTKVRRFAPLINVSVEELVPQDHFYRHLQHTLDLSFVREFVQQTYAGGGRPSIDPVVFFKLQLVMFFEDIVRCANRIRVLKKSLSNLISKEQSIRSCSGHHASQALSNQRQRIEKNKSTTPKRSKSKHKRLPLGMGAVPSLGFSASV